MPVAAGRAPERRQRGNHRRELEPGAAFEGQQERRRRRDGFRWASITNGAAESRRAGLPGVDGSIARRNVASLEAMSSLESAELPDVSSILGVLLARVTPERRPLLIAIAERMAARRYRGWAAEPANAAHAAHLLACADREDEIASRVEALYPNAAGLVRELVAEHPDLEEIDRTLFAGRPLAQQFAIQAAGERLGATTWRSFAARERAAQRRDTLHACAELEEASAKVLEMILAVGG